MPDLPELRDHHARAVRLTMDVVAQTKPADLGRDTPCAGWTVVDLLAHMIVQHRGFAAAATGARSDVADWRPPSLSDDPVAEFATAAEVVIAAFAPDAVADRQIWLPEISPARPFAATDALAFQLVDDVVHAWDLARALDVPLQFDDDLAAATLAVALRVPNDPARRGPGFAFAPGLAAEPGADALDRALAALGRSPAWPR